MFILFKLQPVAKCSDEPIFSVVETVFSWKASQLNQNPPNKKIFFSSVAFYSCAKYHLKHMMLGNMWVIWWKNMFSTPQLRHQQILKKTRMIIKKNGIEKKKIKISGQKQKITLSSTGISRNIHPLKNVENHFLIPTAAQNRSTFFILVLPMHIYAHKFQRIKNVPS